MNLNLQVDRIKKQVYYLQRKFIESGGTIITTFLGLSDTPTTYSGQAGKVVKVKGDESGLEFGTGGSGASTFLDLTDTPSSYTSQSLKAVRVNSGETALEFYTPTTGSGDVTGPASSTDSAIALFDGITGKLLKDSTKVLTTLGGNIASLTNPSAISFIRINADNSVTARTPAETLSDIGAQATLVSGTNIKTLASQSLLGSGNITIADIGAQATGLSWLLASGGTLTGNNTITGTGYTLTGTWNSLGVTQTDGYGLWLRNTTAAAAGAQQISPSIVFEGNGWKTDGPSASQVVKWRMYALPVQGSANPTARLAIGFSVNGGAYSTSAYFNNISSTTNLNIDSITGLGGGTALSFSAGQSFGSASSQLQFLTLGGTAPVSSFWQATGTALSATSGTQNAFAISVNNAGASNTVFAPTSGTAIFNNLQLRGTINQTGGANGNVRMINLEPLYTAAGGSVFGLRYVPAVTSISGQHFARYHNSGFIAWDSVLSPAQITSNQNDYAPNGWNNSSAAPYGASILRLSTDASRDLTGLSGGTSGRLVIISNVGSFDLVIKDESGSSTAANRFALNADITINADEGLMFWYDGTSSRWRALSI